MKIKLDFNMRCFSMRLVTILALSIILSIPVWADDKDNYFVKSCSQADALKPDIETSPCYIYIRGFIEGALLTDTAIINDLEKEKSFFIKRVYQTRGRREGQVLPATYLAEFCLPDDIEMPNIIRKIISDLDEKTLKANTFDQVVYTSLKKQFAC